MKTYLIGYDLNRPRKETDYPELIAKLKEFGTWWHSLDSTWIIKSELTSLEICNMLIPFTDAGDELFVGTLSGPAAWKGFDENASSWLKNQLS